MSDTYNKVDDHSFSVTTTGSAVNVSDLLGEIDTLTARQAQQDANADTAKQAAHDALQAQIDAVKAQLQEAANAGVQDAIDAGYTPV
jgi:multidrug efflux pump subunit AcrA (membrane-fusion protein)